MLGGLNLAAAATEGRVVRQELQEGEEEGLPGWQLQELRGKDKRGRFEGRKDRVTDVEKERGASGEG